MDPSELADAMDELEREIRRLQRRHVRLCEDKPYMFRDLEATRTVLAELEGALTDAKQEPRHTPRRMTDLAQRVNALDAWLTHMEETGLPRRG
jgi:chromosome segregation ATPase